MKPRTCFVAAYVALGLAATLHAQIDCAAWNTEAYFEAAEVSDVTRCLQTGMDPEARSESGYTPLHWAASSGKAETIEVLIAAGANPAARSESGSTPLHTAASSGKAETIEVLLQAGANLEARAEGGLTPLHWAAYWGKAEAIEALLQAGADAKALTTAGELPFDFIKDNAQLQKTDGYWKLYQARFE